MLNQWLYYTIQYLEPNTKYKEGGNHPPLVADVTINSLVTLRLTRRQNHSVNVYMPCSADVLTLRVVTDSPTL